MSQQDQRCRVYQVYYVANYLRRLAQKLGEEMREKIRQLKRILQRLMGAMRSLRMIELVIHLHPIHPLSLMTKRRLHNQIQRRPTQITGVNLYQAECSAESST